MLVLGLILLLVGYLVPIHIVFVIGIVLTIIGALLWVAPSLGLNGGRPLGGRRYY